MEGEKKDSGKLPLGIVIQRQFPRALKAVAECSAFGNMKYKEVDKDWLNCSRVPNGKERYLNAMFRHILEAGKDLNDIDIETGLEHIKHGVWNALQLLEIIELEKDGKQK